MRILGGEGFEFEFEFGFGFEFEFGFGCEFGNLSYVNNPPSKKVALTRPQRGLKNQREGIL